jgi:hypothetical protein
MESLFDYSNRDDFEKAFKRWRQPGRSPNSPGRSVQDDDSTTQDLSNRLAPLSLPTTAGLSVCFGMVTIPRAGMLNIRVQVTPQITRLRLAPDPQCQYKVHRD